MTRKNKPQANRRGKLIAENLEWARQIACHVASTLPTWFTVDDLTGPAELALVQMARKFDACRGVPFRAFAQRRIYGACFDSVRRKEYLERSHAQLEGEPVCTLPSPEEQTAAAEYVNIWASVQQLPARHALVILAFYGGGMTLVEISQLVRVGPARLSQIHREALAMLRAICDGIAA